MFHHRSFSQASFTPRSWRFDRIDEGLPGAGGDDDPLDAARRDADRRRRIERHNHSLLSIVMALIHAGEL